MAIRIHNGTEASPHRERQPLDGGLVDGVSGGGQRLQHVSGVGQADFSPFYPGDPIDFPVDLNQVSLQARVSSLGYCWPASERWFPELDEGDGALSCWNVTWPRIH